MKKLPESESHGSVMPVHWKTLRDRHRAPRDRRVVGTAFSYSL
jgi:hypothetical protein